MRILHVITTIDPAAGGPSESVRVLMSYGPIGYSGEVVSMDDPDAPFLKALPFRVHALGPISTTYGFSPRLVIWLRMNRHRFDGVVVNGLWTFAGLAVKVGLQGKRPYVVFTHGMLDPYFKRQFPLKHIKKWIYWVLAEYWVLRDAFRVLFTTQEESRLAEQSFWLHRWNGFVVPYGTTRPPSDHVEDRIEAFYRQCPAVRGRRFILFLSRIHRKKGCDMLLEAFAKVAASDPELHLVMAGPDQQGWSKELIEMARKSGVEDRVHWPGMLKDDAKWGSFYACEAFTLPSHQENFGIAVAEALACARPVLLSTQVNIAPEVIGDEAGLMEPDTLTGTEQLLVRWIALTTEQRLAMGRRAIACFDRRYDMRRNAEAIIRLFETAESSDQEPRPVWMETAD